MASYNIVPKTAPTLSNLAVYNTLGGANLEWEISQIEGEVWGTEIWFSATNDRSTATLVTTIKGANSYYWQDDDGATGYFWIRAINEFGYTNGAWEPVSSTGGVAMNVPVVSISPTTSVSSASTSSGSSSSLTDPTTWGTWTSQGYANFTTPSSGSGNFNGYITHIANFSAITGAGTFETTKCWIRFRLYNQTDGADVSGEVATHQMLHGIGNTVYAKTDIITHNFNYRYGALGNLLLNKTYRIYVECMKERSASGATITFDCIAHNFEVLANAIS
jgi:hypothetical protein